MITSEGAYTLIVDCIESLVRSESIEPIENLSKDTIVLGVGSVMDSISFITFITEVEDRIQMETDDDYYLVLNEIDAFNINNPHLGLGVLAAYIAATVK